MNIRKAVKEDVSRIAEIYVFNNRQNYYPIFKEAAYSFGKLQVLSIIDEYFSKEEVLNQIYVYDDGVVKGFAEICGEEISKLYVDCFFQNNGIGSVMMEFAVNELGANFLWALEDNVKAIAFYQRYGFSVTDEKMPIENTTKCVVKLKR